MAWLSTNIMSDTASQKVYTSKVQNDRPQYENGVNVLVVSICSLV